MKKNNNIADPKDCYTKIMTLTKELIEVVSEQKPNFVGFDIEPVLKRNEVEYMDGQIKRLSVTTRVDWHELVGTLNSWKTFYKQDNESTLFTSRFPGFVVVSDKKEQVRSLVTQINNHKADIAQAIRHNRNERQRHEYIHQLFPGIITDLLYRQIHVIEDNVTNSWFNWTSRNVPYTMKPSEAKAWLQRIVDKPRLNHEPEQWKARINALIADVDSRIYPKFQRYKSYKCLPTIETKQTDHRGQSKRVKRNATTPIILLGQNGDTLPVYSSLGNYDASNHKHNGINGIAKNKDILDNELKLIGVRNK